MLMPLNLVRCSLGGHCICLLQLLRNIAPFQNSKAIAAITSSRVLHDHDGFYRRGKSQIHAHDTAAVTKELDGGGQYPLLDSPFHRYLEHPSLTLIQPD